MLLFIDGFDHYGGDEARLRDGVYAETNGVTLPTTNPRTGARAARINAGVNNAGLRKVLVEGPVDYLGGLFAFSINSLPTDNRSLGLFQWRNGANGIIASVWITSTGQVVVLNGGRSGTEAAVSDPVVFPGSYQHFEAALNAESGLVCEVRINGVTVINSAIGGLEAGPIAQVKVGANSFPLTGAVGINMDVDDFHLWSGGTGVIDDFMGDVKAYTRFGDSDGAEQEWTPSVGSDGFAMIDNVPPLDTTEYLAATPESVPARSTFGIAPFPAEIVAVRGVMLATRAWKNDAGNAKVQTGVISGAAEALGSDHPVSMTPIWYADVFESDPDTASVWTLETLNALNTVLARTE